MNPRSAKKIALHFLFRVTLPVIKKKKKSPGTSWYAKEGRM